MITQFKLLQTTIWTSVNYLAHKGASILDEETVTAAVQDYAQHPVGTGPYEFVSWRSGDRITLKLIQITLEETFN